MKPRVSASPRTEPIPEAAVKAFGIHQDNPAFKRLISWALGLGSLWLLCYLGGLVQKTGFSLPDKNPELSGTTKDHLTDQSIPEPEVRKAELVQMPVKRALPVIGAHYPASLPDGQRVMTTWKGKVQRFGDLPAQPNIGDQFAVTEGPGHSWIWATPLGWNHPTWIDP